MKLLMQLWQHWVLAATAPIGSIKQSTIVTVALVNRKHQNDWFTSTSASESRSQSGSGLLLLGLSGITSNSTPSTSWSISHSLEILPVNSRRDDKEILALFCNDIMQTFQEVLCHYGTGGNIFYRCNLKLNLMLNSWRTPDKASYAQDCADAMSNNIWPSWIHTMINELMICKPER